MSIVYISARDFFMREYGKRKVFAPAKTNHDFAFCILHLKKQAPEYQTPALYRLFQLSVVYYFESYRDVDKTFGEVPSVVEVIQ